jgi:hypothetical protein
MTHQDVFYFAYGSNLDPDRMKRRTGSAWPATPARLTGYQLTVNKWASHGGVYANIVRQPGSVVWGVAYRCTGQTLDLCQADLGSVPADAVSRSRHSPRWRCPPPHPICWELVCPGCGQEITVWVR